jgi:hypothetical protein
VLHAGDERLAHEAAQVPGFAGIGGAHQHPQLHRALARIGHLDQAHAPVPFARGTADALELGAQRHERHAVVDPQERRAEDLGRVARPVLERFLDEVLQRHHQPALVPDRHDDEGAPDLLDAAPFAFDDHDVIEPDRLRERNLQPGEQIAEDRLRRDAGDDTDDTGRREQTRADLRTSGKVSSASAKPITPISVARVRASTRVCVRMRRACRLSAAHIARSAPPAGRTAARKAPRGRCPASRATASATSAEAAGTIHCSRTGGSCASKAARLPRRD